MDRVPPSLANFPLPPPKKKWGKTWKVNLVKVNKNMDIGLGLPHLVNLVQQFVLVFTFRYVTVLYCTVLYCTVLYCTVLYCTVLYCTVLYCTVLYCTVLYCTVLYCTVLDFSGDWSGHETTDSHHERLGGAGEIWENSVFKVWEGFGGVWGSQGFYWECKGISGILLRV